MVYTPVPSKATSDSWSADDNNTYIRDNFAAGVPDIFTTKGDLAVATGADAAARLALGTTGQNLVVDHSTTIGMKWQTNPNTDLIQAKGDLLAGTAADTLGRLAAGTTGQLLTVDHSRTTGVKWQTNPSIDLIQAKGDLLIGTAADTLARLAVGSTGSFLVADSSQTCGIKWVAPATVAARYTRGSTQAISNNTGTIINFATEDYDTVSAVTTGAAWKFTIPAGKGGIYLIASAALLSSTSIWGVGEYAILRVHKNGAVVSNLGMTYMQAAATIGMFVNGIAIVDCNAADYLDVRITQNSGAALNIAADANYTHVAIAQLMDA